MAKFKVGDLALVNKKCTTHPACVGKIVEITAGLHRNPGFGDDKFRYGIESPQIPKTIKWAEHTCLDPFKKPPDLNKLITDIPADRLRLFQVELLREYTQVTSRS